uniref:Uncharacterized protein n=1 Tax=Arundo donax TaxID=35708 RepID=A0A0A8Z3T2_ARUDO
MASISILLSVISIIGMMEMRRRQNKFHEKRKDDLELTF